MGSNVSTGIALGKQKLQEDVSVNHLQLLWGPQCSLEQSE